MSRKKIIAGNWKMNKNNAEAKDFFTSLISQLPNNSDREIIIAPSFTFLEAAVNLCNGTTIKIAAQNIHSEKEGAFTGEISANMLKNINVSHVIVGHSERRFFFSETDEIISKKVQIAIFNKLTPIICLGESLEERTSNKTFEKISTQLEKALKDVTTKDSANIIIAYEPIWAIGTGKTATTEMVQEVHAFIRAWISEKFTLTIANSLNILYGGSVSSDNAKNLLSQKDVDGALIGGASLNVESFLKIINF